MNTALKLQNNVSLAMDSLSLEPWKMTYLQNEWYSVYTYPQLTISTSKYLSPSTKHIFVITIWVLHLITIWACYYNSRQFVITIQVGQLLQFKAIVNTIQGRIWRYYNSGQFLLQFKAIITIWVDYYNSGLYNPRNIDHNYSTSANAGGKYAHGRRHPMYVTTYLLYTI